MYGDCMKWCSVCDEYYEDLSPRSYSRAPECPRCAKGKKTRRVVCEHGSHNTDTQYCPQCATSAEAREYERREAKERADHNDYVRRQFKATWED